MGNESCCAAQALTGQFLLCGLHQHHPATEARPWLLVRGHQLRRKAAPPLPELTGQLIGPPTRVGLLVMDAGGADQGRILKRSTQVEEGTLRGQPQPEGVAFPTELLVPGLHLLSTGLCHGAVPGGPQEARYKHSTFCFTKNRPSTAQHEPGWLMVRQTRHRLHSPDRLGKQAF